MTHDQAGAISDTVDRTTRAASRLRPAFRSDLEITWWSAERQLFADEAPGVRAAQWVVQVADHARVEASRSRRTPTDVLRLARDRSTGARTRSIYAAALAYLRAEVELFG